MSLRRMDAVSLGAIGLSAAVTAAVYAHLPERIATHFDIHGNPDGWMSRPWGAWFMPAFALGLWAIVRLSPKVLPSSDKKRLPEAIVALVASMTAVFMAAVHLMILRVALVPGASIMRPLWFAMGIMWIALGLVMPRIRRNPLVGVRTPWTLTSDENWARTQRVGGYAMVLGGIAGLFAALVGGPAAAVFALVAMLGSAIVPVVYSLVYARRQDEGS